VPEARWQRLPPMIWHVVCRRDGHCAILKFDIKNAFNCVLRRGRFAVRRKLLAAWTCPGRTLSALRCLRLTRRCGTSCWRTGRQQRKNRLPESTRRCQGRASGGSNLGGRRRKATPRGGTAAHESGASVLLGGSSVSQEDHIRAAFGSSF
jgi:hypothetical protein